MSLLLYIIGESEDGPCKIGYGKNPQHRLRNLQVGNTHKLTLYSTWLSASHMSVIRCERALHYAFAGEHIRGEWFRVSVICVDKACKDLGMVKAGSTYDFTRKPQPGDTRLSWLI